MAGFGMVALENYWEAVGTEISEICSVSEKVNKCITLGIFVWK